MNFGTIAEAKHVLIEQEMDWTECIGQRLCCLPCCERSNKYLLWKCEDEDFEVADTQLGDFIEESSCICRTCCQSTRSFSGGLSIRGVRVAIAESPYKCRSCNILTCCVAKPELRVSLNNNYIGKIVQPYYGPCWGTRNKLCCPMMELSVYNGADELLYTISQSIEKIYLSNLTYVGKCCQKSVWCLPFQCCGCKIITYEIRDAANKFVGNIKNMFNGTFKECCTKQDKFGISFEAVQSPKDKVLLLNAVLWLDYLQYSA